MKRFNRISTLLVAFLVFFGLAANAVRVFAANPYGINYSGGVSLSANNVVSVNTSLSSMTALYTGGTVTYSDSPIWEHAYKLGDDGETCSEYTFFRLWDSNRIGANDDVYYKLSNSNYDVKVKINKVVLEGLTGLSKNGDNVTVGAGSWLGAGTGNSKIFSDKNCKTDHYDTHLKDLVIADNGRIFVDTTITLYRQGTNEVFTSDKLYFGILDIDAAQSYKFMNASARLAGNMYVMNASALDVGNTTLRNMFVSSGNYIYSEYNASTGGGISTTNNNIYFKVDTAAQEEGLNVIFGFAKAAASAVQYYGQQYKVTYASDENGAITGKKSENVVSGNNPTGSTQAPAEGYTLTHWVADKDVTLNDNTTTIAAGEPLSMEQIEQVVVNQNLTFTALHETIQLNVAYQTDENGALSGIDGEPVAYNSNPEGSSTTPNEGFVLDHWAADKDVTLTNGETVAANQPLTNEQVTQVKVTENLIFTAIHRDTRLNVTYTSDEHGEIRGKEEEKVLPNGNPTGSSTTPETGFVLDYWVADKDVVLEDGTEIEAGDPIEDEEVTQVVVTEDLEFTAIHLDVRLNVTYFSDDYGQISGKEEEIVLPNDNPTGSSTTPVAGFVFDHWVADKDVVLEDGTEIKAGLALSTEEVEQVVTTEDLEFTAIHRDVRLKVAYISDDHGEISGNKNEIVIPNDNPSGSASTPEEGFVFDHWVADKDVVLEDGTEIKAGEPMTAEEVEAVVVTEDLRFLAVHRDIRLRVVYNSDEHGQISGISNEPIVPNQNPTGSKSTPEDGFVFDYWVADKDVVLEDGTEIKAGEPIEDEEVAQVVVTEDLTFTAIHLDVRVRATYDSDEYGVISGETEETLAPGSIIMGSESDPKGKYVFAYWIADKDVGLDDGTEIKAGAPITPEELEHVVLYEDTKFTAIHEKVETPEVPNTGLFSNGVFGEGEITVSVLAFSIIAALLKLIPIIFHKKIKFEK